MKKMQLHLLIALVFSFTFSNSFSQFSKPDGAPKIGKKWTNENGNYISLLAGDSFDSFDFNFFHGNDLANFKTTLKGLGSLGNSSAWPVFDMGTEHFGLNIKLGYVIRYYRFEQNLSLDYDENTNSLTTSIVDNPPYEFTNTFFSWSKNKMVIAYLTVPLGFDIKLSFVDLRFQAAYNLYVAGKHKVKYIDEADAFDSQGKVFMQWLVGDKREKYKTPNSEFKTYPINKNNICASVILIPKINGKKKVGIGLNYDYLPLFIEGSGPDIHEVSISIFTR